MSDPSAAGRDAIDELAETFVARLRAGEHPSVEEYVRRYPHLAEEVRDLLPALVLLEQNAIPGATAAGPSRLDPPAGQAAPREIGEFTILREIGRGGMGVVYEAIQQSLGRHVALKVLPAASLINPTHLARFRFEARAAARLHHTHIVPVFGVGEHEGLHYYAMQYIAGQSLDAVIAELRRTRNVGQSAGTLADGADALTRVARALTSGSLIAPASEPPDAALPAEEQTPTPIAPVVVVEESPAAQHAPTSGSLSSSKRHDYYQSVARVGLQVAEALAYAHGEGILHRDVKPSNLLVDAKGNVWITDFGLAKDQTADGLTHTGDFVGTLRYMSPERLDGWSDPRSDVYGLGVTLYEMLTLRPLFDDSNRGKLVEHIFYNAPTPPSRLDAAIPSDLETIVLKAIAKEPGERYRTAAEMAEDLRRFLLDRPILARRSTPREQLWRWCRRNPLAASLAGAVAALVLVALGILTVSNARIRSESTARATALEQKDGALETAHDAINQMLTRTASSVFVDAPRLHPVRVALLEDALLFYEALAAQSGDDPRLRYKMADVLRTKAGLERELDELPAAQKSLERCIKLLNPLVPLDPAPPEYLVQLAVAHQDLGLTLHFMVENHNSPEAELNFQRAFDLFDDASQRWPGLAPPVTLCIRHLAEYATQRGDNARAKSLLRTAIERGEQHGNVHPDDLNETHEIAWACTQLYDLLMTEEPPSIAEAESTLRRGLAPLDEQLKHDPHASSAIDVGCSLRFRLGTCYCRQQRGDEALAEFTRAIHDMEGLCEAFPWNDYYWGTLAWFNEDMAVFLRSVGRGEQARAMLEEYRVWLDRVAEELPDDAGPRAKLQRGKEYLERLIYDAEMAESER